MIMSFDLKAHIFHTSFMKGLCSQVTLMTLFRQVKDVVLDHAWQVIPVGLSERQLLLHCHGFIQLGIKFTSWKDNEFVLLYIFFFWPYLLHQ